MLFRSILSLAFFCGALATSATAQTDRVYPQTGEMQIGKFVSSSRGGVTLNVSGSDENFAVSNIERMMFQGDPSEMTNGREFALSGQYDQALEELRRVDPSDLPREIMKSDLAYYLLYCRAGKALAGQGDLTAAAKAALAFVSKHSETWYFYPSVRLLGDLAAALGNYDKAIRYYQTLSKGPSTEMKIQAVLLTGITNLKRGKLDEAQSQLQKVADLSVQSAEAARMKTRAKAALAETQAKRGDGKAGLKLVKELIGKLNPTDTELAADIYNAQGASYQATGDTEGAVLAYLHTDLMFSSSPQQHAEALRQLAKLWKQVGKPERAAQARAELQQRYPGLGS